MLRSIGLAVSLSLVACTAGGTCSLAVRCDCECVRCASRDSSGNCTKEDAVLHPSAEVCVKAPSPAGVSCLDLLADAGTNGCLEQCAAQLKQMGVDVFGPCSTPKREAFFFDAGACSR
jgi:hypothetical protein